MCFLFPSHLAIQGMCDVMFFGRGAVFPKCIEKQGGGSRDGVFQNAKRLFWAMRVLCESGFVTWKSYLGSQWGLLKGFIKYRIELELNLWFSNRV